MAQTVMLGLQFLGLASYYSYFVCHFASLTASLTGLSEICWIWHHELDSDWMFQETKEILC